VIWGLEEEAAYGRLGEILAEDETTVTRPFELPERAFTPGDKARTDSYARPNDP